MNTLSESDYKLIKICKSNDIVKYDSVKEYWCERCAIEKKYFYIQYVVQTMVEILDFCKRWDANTLIDFLYDNQPYKDDWFGEKPIEGNEYWTRLFSRLCSMIRLTLADDIPGYRDWIESIKN